LEQTIGNHPFISSTLSEVPFSSHFNTRLCVACLR
jgi:hypothetical protein